MYTDKNYKFDRIDENGLRISRIACDGKCPLYQQRGKECKKECQEKNLHALRFEDLFSFSATDKEIRIDSKSGVVFRFCSKN